MTTAAMSASALTCAAASAISSCTCAFSAFIFGRSSRMVAICSATSTRTNSPIDAPPALRSTGPYAVLRRSRPPPTRRSHPKPPAFAPNTQPPARPPAPPAPVPRPVLPGRWGLSSDDADDVLDVGEVWQYVVQIGRAHV